MTTFTIAPELDLTEMVLSPTEKLLEFAVEEFAADHGRYPSRIRLTHAQAVALADTYHSTISHYMPARKWKYVLKYRGIPIDFEVDPEQPCP